jgi:hypothetical protein
MRWTDSHALVVRHVQNTSCSVSDLIKDLRLSLSVSISGKGNVVGISCRGAE